MRLIKTTTLELHDFFHVAWDKASPTYAILSHCWGSDEVTYKDFVKKRKTDSAGHRKIVECCKFALSRGHKWVWIDTCCIDKRSSSELSEAINSMYDYYALAAECYAFLEDVDFSDEQDPQSVLPAFRASRWFTRGWTLQELIAPKSVLFLTRKWKAFGSKCGHRDLRGYGRRDMNGRPLHVIEAKLLTWAQTEFPRVRAPGESAHSHSSAAGQALWGEEQAVDHDILVEELIDITAIPKTVLMDPTDGLKYVSIATKLSWMARRSITRIEDESYCLLGLLDVNMPLLYGEGDKAFIRLQTEIMRVSNDESMFSWIGAQQPQNLLAPHPQYFSNVASAQHCHRAPYAVTNQGLRLELAPFSGAYIDSREGSVCPEWILITLNAEASHDEPIVRSFMYIKRLSCGHYMRRQVRSQTVERTLSRRRIRRFCNSQHQPTSIGFEDTDSDTTSNGPVQEVSECAAELDAALTVYIHLNPSQVCNIPGNGGERDFITCVERHTTLIDKLAEIDRWMQQCSPCIVGSMIPASIAATPPRSTSPSHYESRRSRSVNGSSIEGE